jgi:acyl CoA:acetate/3-ketoacid CoA transferase alpha subunit
MKTAQALPLLLVSVVTAGCADLNNLARDEAESAIHHVNTMQSVKEVGAVYVWPPYSSAAVVDKEGNRCVLVASGAKTIDASSEAALKLGNALEKIEGLDASTKSTLVETFTKLSAADSRAAFADVALFHLCILDQNGTFKSPDKAGNENKKAEMVMNAYLQTIKAATGWESGTARLTEGVAY